MSVHLDFSGEMYGFRSPVLAGNFLELLKLCGRIEEPAKRIAADIARCLKSEPVWGWPDIDGESPSAQNHIEEHLFTAVIIFGQNLENHLFGQSVPETLGAAQIIKSPSLDELANSPAERSKLWNHIKNCSLSGFSRTSAKT